MDYCAITYDGVLLDEIIPGYTTANVEGRTLLGRSIQSVDIPGRAGVYVRDQTVPARQIRVSYVQKSPNGPTKVERENQLHRLLSSPRDVPFSFGDEPGWTRFGRLSQVSPPPKDQLEGQGTFTILCQDPYKYRAPETFTTTSIPADLADNAITEIRLTVSAPLSMLRVTNRTTGDSITLEGSYTAGQVVVINLADHMRMTIMRGAESVLADLTLDSDPESFKIKGGDEVVVNSAGVTATFTVRRRAL